MRNRTRVSAAAACAAIGLAVTAAPHAAGAAAAASCDTGSGTVGSGTLARTGLSVGGWVAVAAALLVLGGLALAASRSRKVSASTLAVLLLAGVLAGTSWASVARAATDCGTGVASAATSSTTSSVPASTSTTSTSTSTSTSTTSSTTTSTTVPVTTTTTEPAPRCEDGSLMPVNDKSAEVDHDGDGKVDRCDDDSDGDGIPDTVEDLNHNGLYEDDDVDGDRLYIGVTGDGVSSYLDLDSDDDSVLDATEGQANTDGDDKLDFVDLKSNGPDLDLYVNCFDEYDQLGGGFITPKDDTDDDGVQAVVDSSPTTWGATQLTDC